ncbi:MAG: GNAT family N-acetyltransferase [Bacteroidaceae bacterium]|nr:GNAT family N-acetyltransferase [Bacteroidaceae bacterium]
MEYIRHTNECWWGTSIKLVTTDGYAMVELAILKEDPECGFVCGLVVHPLKRRQHIATSLLQEVDNEAFCMGLKKLFLHVEKTQWVHEWYRRIEWVDSENQDLFVPTVLMWKNVSRSGVKRIISRNHHVSLGEKLSLYEQASEVWGATNLALLTMEECGEMLDKLGKLNRDRTTPDEVVEELADVSIMMEQMAVAFGLYEKYTNIQECKLTRLKERLAGNKTNKVPH